MKRVTSLLLCAALAWPAPVALRAQPAATPRPGRPTLPPPAGAPLAIDPSADPLLRLSRQTGDLADFRALVAGAVARYPLIAEAEAQRAEAEAARTEARSLRYPTVDVNIGSQRVLAREFDNDPNNIDNIVERSRRTQRTDAILNAEQVLFDFGATSRRISAARSRLEAAALGVDSAVDRVALRAIGAWYEVHSYRALVGLTEAFAEGQAETRAAIEQRIAQGVTASGDLARVDSYQASAASRLARFRRQLAGAETRFREFFGAPAPAGLARAPAPPGPALSAEAVRELALRPPDVRAAELVAQATRTEVRAVRAEQLPRVTAGLDAGRYGVFETERDYDIRARLGVRHRISLGAGARTDQARARAEGAEARARTAREEALREAEIARADIETLQRQLGALEEAYLASRRSRDVLAERFRVARGSLFDLIEAEDALFETATAYLLALAELDTARYILLSRTGQLVTALDLPRPEPAPRPEWRLRP